MGILDRFSLDGRVALVSGGASGYGRQVVDSLAEAGASVYMASRNVEALQAVASEHVAQGRKAAAMRMDQGDPDSILGVVSRVLGDAGRIDVLVNNAAARPMKKGYHDDASTFEESMRVNATGLFVITRAVGDAMAKQNSGSIINIGSIYGLAGPDWTHYIGTDMNSFVPDYYFHKGGMVNFTRFIGSYYGQYGIRCNCVHPGGLTSDTHPERFVQQYNMKPFLGRMANSTDLKGIIVFLASDASLYITGTNIPLDGGYTAK